MAERLFASRPYRLLTEEERHEYLYNYTPRTPLRLHRLRWPVSTPVYNEEGEYEGMIMNPYCNVYEEDSSSDSEHSESGSNTHKEPVSEPEPEPETSQDNAQNQNIVQPRTRITWPSWPLELIGIYDYNCEDLIRLCRFILFTFFLFVLFTCGHHYDTVYEFIMAYAISLLTILLLFNYSYLATGIDWNLRWSILFTFFLFILGGYYFNMLGEFIKAYAILLLFYNHSVAYQF